jgi:hypothetical protein
MGFWDFVSRVLGGERTAYDRPPVQQAPFSLPPSHGSIRVAEPVAPPPPAAPERPPPDFGIDRAIELMRTLPLEEDPDLVLRVVRKTLQFTGISLLDLVTAATDREAVLSDSLVATRAQIDRLLAEVATLRDGISGTEADLADTKRVREQLEEALENETVVVASLPPLPAAPPVPGASPARAAPASISPVPLPSGSARPPPMKKPARPVSVRPPAVRTPTVPPAPKKAAKTAAPVPKKTISVSPPPADEDDGPAGPAEPPDAQSSGS